MEEGHLTQELLSAVMRREVDGLELAVRLIAHMTDLCAECDVAYQRWRKAEEGRRATASESSQREPGEAPRPPRAAERALKEKPLYQALAQALEESIWSLGETPEERALAFIRLVEGAREAGDEEGREDEGPGDESREKDPSSGGGDSGRR